jgi:hypothetical protein
MSGTGLRRYRAYSICVSSWVTASGVTPAPAAGRRFPTERCAEGSIRMRVRRPASLAAGGLCAVLLAVGLVLPAAGAPVDLPRLPAPSAAGLLLVRHAGTAPVTVDTTRLTGPALRAWWVDGVGDRTVDAGAVPREPAVKLFPPDTGDGSPHDWTLVIVDATRGLLPPA